MEGKKDVSKLISGLRGLISGVRGPLLKRVSKNLIGSNEQFFGQRTKSSRTQGIFVSLFVRLFVCPTS